MKKKDIKDKYPELDYIEVKAFSDCRLSGLPIVYFVFYIMGKTRLRKSKIYSDYRQYLKITGGMKKEEKP